MDNIKIVIFTCSNYSDLWKNHVDLLNKYWESHPDFVLCSDGESKFDNDVKNLMIIEGSMTTRIIDSISSIEEDYVFLTFDDYFINKKVNDEVIRNLFAYMTQNNYDYCRLFSRPKIRAKEKLICGAKKLPLINTYEVNYYPGIWKKSSLLAVLRKDEDIWKSEVRLTRRFRENNFKGMAIDNKNIYSFVDVIRKGKYLRNAYRYLKKNNLFISDRPVRTVKETVKLDIQTFVSDILPKRLKVALKKHYNKKGKTFYSDYEATDD